MSSDFKIVDGPNLRTLKSLKLHVPGNPGEPICRGMNLPLPAARGVVVDFASLTFAIKIINFEPSPAGPRSCRAARCSLDWETNSVFGAFPTLEDAADRHQLNHNQINRSKICSSVRNWKKRGRIKCQNCRTVLIFFSFNSKQFFSCSEVNLECLIA